MGELSAPDLEALGIYDPAAPEAARRLELLRYLIGLGATEEDLVAFRDGLPGLASVLAMRRGAALTVSELAARAGVSEEWLLRLMRAAGFADPGPDAKMFGEDFAELIAGVARAAAVFGEDAAFQLIRVMGSAMARLADAIVSAFLVNVEPAARGEQPGGLGIARANAEAAALVPTVNATLDILLRQHIVAARRSIPGDAAEVGYETRHLCVGFVDLVGSTELAQRLRPRELGSLLGEFERIASDAVTSAGGRVVKLVGDGILYTTTDEASACAIAVGLAATFAAHPTIPIVRGGLAAGEVMLRDGDVFGPVVNLAARVVEVAAAGEVVAPVALAAASGVAAEPLGRRDLRGFGDGIELCRLRA